MAFTPKEWKNDKAGGTKLNAAALIDLEKRVTAAAALLDAPNAFTETQTIAAGKRLGIGTTAPESSVHLVENATGQPRGLTVDVLSGTVNGGSILLRKGRGAPGSPAAILKGDSVGAVCFNGYDGTEYPNSHQALVQGFATENWEHPGKHGCKLQFAITPNSTEGSPVYRLFLDQSGYVGIDSESPEAALHIGQQRHIIAPTIRLQDGSGTPGGNVNATLEVGNTQSGWTRFGRFGAINDTENTRVIVDSSQASVPVVLNETGASVGIGIKKPLGNFDVVNPSGAAVMRLRTTSEQNTALLLQSLAASAEADIWTTGAMSLVLGTNQVQGLKIDTVRNVILGSASITTTSTGGFPWIPTAAGAPTGVPSVPTGFAAMYYDKTNFKLWIFTSAGWKGATFA